MERRTKNATTTATVVDRHGSAGQDTIAVINDQRTGRRSKSRSCCCCPLADGAFSLCGEVLLRMIRKADEL